VAQQEGGDPPPQALAHVWVGHLVGHPSEGDELEGSAGAKERVGELE
jgi:hypothetical protein